MGTPEALTQTAEFVRSLQERQDVLIGSPEFTAFKKNYINKSQLKKLISKYPKGYYRSKMERLID